MKKLMRSFNYIAQNWLLDNLSTSSRKLSEFKNFQKIITKEEVFLNEFY